MPHINFDSFSNIIDGKLVATTSFHHGINPANNNELWPAPLSTTDDVQAAVDAAKRGAQVWAATPIADRQQKIIQLADELANNTESFAKILTQEQGKPVSDSDGHGCRAWILPLLTDLFSLLRHASKSCKRCRC